MKKTLHILLACFTVIGVQSCMDNRHAKNYNDKTMVDDGGLSFIKNGIEGGMTEVKASKLAKANSSNPRVINLADMMIADHTHAGEELKKIEAAKLVDARGDTINMEHQKAIVALSGEKGAEFDKAYIEMMVADHEKTMELFTEATGNTSNLIQNFSRKTLPTIRMHLDSAKAIAASLK